MTIRRAPSRALAPILAILGVGIGALLTACFAAPGEEEVDDGAQRVEIVDPLEGAYTSVGGTPLHFVFKRGDEGAGDTFLGEIEVDGQPQRAKGAVVLGRDGLGTTFTLKPAAATPSAEELFSGTKHFLRIGKNQTVLVRGDVSGKTSHLRKVKSWCSGDADCAPEVQRTGLSCEGAEPVCSRKSTCACE